MPIIGIGTDMIEVHRIKKAIEGSQNFTNRIFSSEEIQLCNEKSNPFQSFAARFAAKESFLKALGTGWSQGIEWTDILILSDENGAPQIHLKGKAQELCEQKEIDRVHVSISHLKEYASAYVILEKV